MASRQISQVRSGVARHPRRFGRHLARISAATVLAVGVLLAAPIPAWAHASVESTSPADGSVVAEAPDRFSMVFNEDVTVPVAGLRVYDSNGQRVDLGDGGGGEPSDQKSVSLEPGLGDGPYIATFRAVSADGHPIRGAFVFQVGEPGAAPDQATIDGLLAGGDDGLWVVVGSALRFGAYASALMVIGWVLLGRRMQAPRSKVLGIAAIVCAACSLLQIPTFAAEVTGLGFGALTSGSAMSDAVTSSVGQSALLRAILVPLAVTLPSSAAVFAAVGAALSELISGHTRTVEPAWIMLPAGAVHVVSAAVWVGGLAILALGWAGETTEWRRHAVTQFSSVALGTVAAMTVAGVAMSWATVRTPDALLTTTYGRALMVKVGLVVLVLFVAAANRRLVGAGADLGRIWQNVRIELVGIGLIVGVTAFLVGTQPAADAAGITGPATATVEFGDGLLDIVVDPGDAGLNELHLYVLDRSGLPANVSGDATVLLSLPLADIGPIEREPIVAGTGHFLLRGPELAVPGEWTIRFELRTSAFDQSTTEATVTIR